MEVAGATHKDDKATVRTDLGRKGKAIAVGRARSVDTHQLRRPRLPVPEEDIRAAIATIRIQGMEVTGPTHKHHDRPIRTDLGIAGAVIATGRARGVDTHQFRRPRLPVPYEDISVAIRIQGMEVAGATLKDDKAAVRTDLGAEGVVIATGRARGVDTHQFRRPRLPVRTNTSL